jgi:hypothetical protein
MNESTITGPNCDHRFELSDALRSQIRSQLEGEVKEQLTQREVALKKRDDELKERQTALEKSQSEIDDQVAKRLQAKSAELKAEAEKELKEQLATAKAGDGKTVEGTRKADRARGQKHHRALRRHAGHHRRPDSEHSSSGAGWGAKSRSAGVPPARHFLRRTGRRDAGAP